MSNSKDFIIEDGVLIRYEGNDEHIITPEGIISIDSYAFANKGNLRSVVIREGVISIGECVFEGCTYLEKIVIPKSVVSIGAYLHGHYICSCENVVIYCEAPKRPIDWDEEWNYPYRPVVWDCQNNNKANDGCIHIILEDIHYKLKKEVAIVGRHISTRETLIIKPTIVYEGKTYRVESIDNYAFLDCQNIKKVFFPYSIISIGKDAFSFCQNLLYVLIPDNNRLLGIGEGAFSRCGKLQYFRISKETLLIGREAFAGCSNLRVYCEEDTQPITWSDDWNPDNCPVIWGYKGE
ncbi:MAG: leucine-rich repeat domain-containing protein [Clostridiales bacterium]|nr:leucine-rich repeat domain-containing protein [Clostridiales bacterium]